MLGPFQLGCVISLENQVNLQTDESMEVCDPLEHLRTRGSNLHPFPNSDFSLSDIFLLHNEGLG